ncbi:hypothetical protein [Limibacillus sp. MBR-115]|uniref:hypothetical protein n=1 Tax=Limibacillus sp. MBR-115 TaxID=3156465 RepID=UPI00339944C2
MAAKMATTDSSGMMSVDCQACDRSGKEDVTPTCDMVCTTSMTAILVKEVDLVAQIAHQNLPILNSILIGRSAHNDPDPPRNFS